MVGIPLSLVGGDSLCNVFYSFGSACCVYYTLCCIQPSVEGRLNSTIVLSFTISLQTRKTVMRTVVMTVMREVMKEKKRTLSPRVKSRCVL